MKDIWSERAANPKAFNEMEKTLYEEVEPIIKDFLEELKKGNKIEIATTPAEIDQLRSVIGRYHVATAVHNFMLGIYKAPETANSFLNVNKPFGMDDTLSVGLYLQAALFVDLLCTELFKLLVLFHLKEVDYDVSKFSNTMLKAAPIAWTKMKPYLDNPFRNAIAHCTLSVRNRQVVLYRDAKLVPIDTMEISEFMIRLKRTNIIFICLFNTLAELKRQGWFTS
jgi:hypothetical protein